MDWVLDSAWVDWNVRERLNRIPHDDGLPFIHYGLDHELKLCWIWWPNETIEHLAERLKARTDYVFCIGQFTYPWLGVIG